MYGGIVHDKVCILYTSKLNVIKRKHIILTVRFYLFYNYTEIIVSGNQHFKDTWSIDNCHYSG